MFVNCVDGKAKRFFRKGGAVNIQEKKELLKLLSDYQDETKLNVLRWSSFARKLDNLIDNPFVRKSNEIAKVACYLHLDIVESAL